MRYVGPLLFVLIALALDVSILTRTHGTPASGDKARAIAAAWARVHLAR